MIKLFNLNNYKVDFSKFKNHLHDKNVIELENSIAKYVGAKYACSINSATNAIFLLFLNKKIQVKVPSMIPPVVLNALITSGNSIKFTDNTEWIGDSYILHEFKDYKIIDSAQKVQKNQFKNEANPNDIMFFSFYPTKPIGGIDGGMIVSDDYDKICWLKEAVMNGMSYADNNWERQVKFPGYKMYMNSIQAEIVLRNFDKFDLTKNKLKNIRDFYNKKFNLNNTSDHLYRIEVNNNKNFIEAMRKNEITCGFHYEAQNLNPIYSKNDQKCPNSERISKKTVSIPFHYKLTKTNLNYIIKKVNEYRDL